MPESNVIAILPERAQAAPQALTLPTPFTQGRIDKFERARTNTRWGDLSASTLTSVLNRAATGDIADWVDLCEFAIGTDPKLTSLYDTRISRVAQADYIIKPNQFGNPQQAELAAEFVNESMGRIEDLQQTFRDLLHAIAVGIAGGEMVWQRDEVSRCFYVARIDFRNAHRLRYDEAWQPRLYDFGRRRGEGSRFGEALDPRTWVIHQYRVIAGYPGIGGLMRGCVYPWMFGRWVEKFWIADAEKNGSPMIYAVVPPNTPLNVRQRIQDDLQNLSNDHVGTMEQGVTIEAQAAAAAVKSYENYVAYLQRRDSTIAECWHGSSDISSPGEHGSQAAVSTRASVGLDPRMVTDGEGLAASLQKTLFKQLIALNRHKFGVPLEQIPLPSMKLKTADDEVTRDPTGKAEEMQAERDGYTPEVGRDITSQPGKPPKPGAPKQAPIALLPETVAMSYGDMLQIVKASTAGDIGKEAAFEMIVCGGIEQSTAIRMLGLPQHHVCAASTADPKAVAPASPGQTTRTRRTSSRSPSPFAKALRSGSAASASSSSKRSPKQP